MRTVFVTPPSAAQETAQVFQAVLLIAVVALLVSSAGRGRAGAGPPLGNFQVRFGEQAQATQRVYRELSAGLEEMLAMRQAAQGWPTAEQLAAEGVEPFGGGAWERRYENGILNYVGRDARDPGSPYYMLSIAEPPPGSNGREGHLGPLDRTHRLLADGRMIHVGIWMNPRPRPEKDALEWPQRAGWTEIVSAPAVPR